MSEVDSINPREGAAAESGLSHAGASIRQAREVRGQSLLQLSLLLKISERRLQAFEEGRWADVGDRTFVRALAQRLCRHLEIDPQPILQSLPAAAAEPRPQPDRGPMPSVAPKALSSPLRLPSGSGASVVGFTPVRLGVAVILMAAAVLALAPADWWSRVRPGPSESGPEGLAVMPPQQASSPSVAASDALVSSPGSPGDATPAAAAASAPAALTAGAAVSTPPVATSASAPVAAATAPSAALPDLAAMPLQIKATQDTWVQVTDAKGSVLLSRLLRSGEQVGLEGSRPLKLRVGNVAGTEASWWGRRVALDDVKRNNVADVELP